MKLLMHTCCGVCLLGCLRALAGDNFQVTPFFFGPNIHPYREFAKRLRAFEVAAEIKDADFLVERKYGLDKFLATVQKGPDPPEGMSAPFGSKSVSRCYRCYRLRVFEIARIAAEKGFDAFSSSMMISKHQSHELLSHTGKQAEEKFGIPFFYRDLTSHLDYAASEAKKRSLYRQQYCGCIFSEQERFDSALRVKKSGEQD